MIGAIGAWPYGLRLIACFGLIMPPAFLMGFPFATGMAMLSRLGKERFFIWAWGINGFLSVVGSLLAILGLASLVAARLAIVSRDYGLSGRAGAPQYFEPVAGPS